MRADFTTDGGIGLCVDVKHAYASEAPLPVGLTRRDFRRWQGSRCIYHYGLDWYKIRLDDLSDLNVSEELCADLVVGIDVKHNTAGFTVVGKNGAQVLPVGVAGEGLPGGDSGRDGGELQDNWAEVVRHGFRSAE